MMSWNCNGKLSQANNFIGQYTSPHDIIHLSGSKHNSYTTFKVPGGFKCISRPGCRRNVDRGGIIVYIKNWLYKYIKVMRYFKWGIILYFSTFTIVLNILCT